jgi:hypothetical protein
LLSVFDSPYCIRPRTAYAREHKNHTYFIYVFKCMGSPNFVNQTMMKVLKMILYDFWPFFLGIVYITKHRE